jgi:hypothetical protein
MRIVAGPVGIGIQLKIGVAGSTAAQLGKHESKKMRYDRLSLAVSHAATTSIGIICKVTKPEQTMKSIINRTGRRNGRRTSNGAQDYARGLREPALVFP